MDQALKKSINSIDGVFTFMIAGPDSIGFAKDRFAMKPIVLIEQDGSIAAATEEQAVRRVFKQEAEVVNHDGPALSGIWMLPTQSKAA